MPKEPKVRRSQERAIAAARAALSDPRTPRSQKKAASKILATFGLNSPKAGKTGLRRSPTLSKLPRAAAVSSMSLASAAAASPSGAEHTPPAVGAAATPAPTEEAANSSDSVTVLADTLQSLEFTSKHPDAKTEP